MSIREWFDFQIAMCYLRMSRLARLFSQDVSDWCIRRGDRIRDKYLCAEED